MSESSDDTIIVDDYPVVFNDMSVVDDMTIIFKEVNKIPESPVLGLNVMVSRDGNRFGKDVQTLIENEIKNEYHILITKFLYYKNMLIRDYYAVKEFTDPIKLKFIKGSVTSRYNKFLEWIQIDFNEFIALYNEINHFDMRQFHFNFSGDMDCNRLNGIYTEIRLKCDILNGFDITPLLEKKDNIIRICKESKRIFD